MIYDGTKLVYDKIGALVVNSNRNAKPWLTIRLEEKVNNLWELLKVLRKEKLPRIFWDEKTKKKEKQTADKFDNAT